MIWFFILICILVFVPMYDKAQDRKRRQKWTEMDRRGAFRLQDFTQWASYKNGYDYDWAHDRTMYPKELIKTFEDNPQARKQYAEIKIAQTQWAQGKAPVRGVISPELARANPNPDLQYAAFMHKYAPKDSDESAS